MKKLFLLLLFLKTSFLKAQIYETFTDSRDGIKYKSIRIGTQIWMAQNLNTDRFLNGDPITEVKTTDEWIRAARKKIPAWCYYNNDPKLGLKYGKLYNGYALEDPRGLAPEGWQIPNSKDWNLLVAVLSNDETTAGAKIKSALGWYKKGNGTNKSGFTALPGGGRNSRGIFRDIEKSGNWRSTDLLYYVNYDNDQIGVCADCFDYASGFSLRCIKK